MKKRKNAFCFDLDGTITSQEILPLISRDADLYEEMNLLTDMTLKGLIPFTNSFRLRVKLLSSIPISRVQSIIEHVELQPSIVCFIKEHKEDSFIVTGNLDVWVKKLTNALGCKVYSSTADYQGDQLLGIKHILNKGDAVMELKNHYDYITAIGDSMNDAPMFEKADCRIAYGGIHAPVENIIQLSNFVTYSQDGLCNILNTL